VILTLFRGDKRPEGVEFSARCAHFNPADEAQLLQDLELLALDGDVYTIIHEAHYCIAVVNRESQMHIAAFKTIVDEI